MLIKITLILIVISIAFYIITKVYVRTLSTGSKLRLTCTTNYTLGEKILFMTIGFTYMITFTMVVITIINLILKYL